MWQLINYSGYLKIMAKNSLEFYRTNHDTYYTINTETLNNRMPTSISDRETEQSMRCCSSIKQIIFSLTI